MSAAELPDNEVQRLARLRRLAVLDTPPEPLFDHLTRLAAEICETPIALVSLVDEDRQWFKAEVGLGTPQTAREHAFCAHSLHQPQVLEVADALSDPRFADNPLVLSAPHIRFYAGAPIVLDDGTQPGTLCVIDRRPRTLTDRQRRLLVELADAVAEGLMLRERQVRAAVTTALQRHPEALVAALAQTQALLDRTGRLAGVGGWRLDLRTEEMVWTEQTCRIHDLPPDSTVTLAQALSYYPPEGRAAMESVLARARDTGEGWDGELPLVTAQGRQLWVRSLGEVDVEDGRPVRIQGAIQDITAHHRLVGELQQNRDRLRSLYESTPALMHAVDAEGRIVKVSDDWLSWLGYQREDVIGRSIEEFLYDTSAVEAYRDRRETAVRNGRFRNRPSRVRAADGSARDVLVSATTEFDPSGRPSRFMVFVTDITEDLRRQAQLRDEQRLRQQLERHAAELDRLLQERSEMLDVLAHEVRQPLNNASAALQSAALALAGTGEEKILARVTRAQGVLGQVQAGVDNTLAAASLLAAGAPFTQLETDIDTLLGVCIADFAPEQRKRVVIDRQSAARTALMDLNLMRLALRNLLSNALKYSPAGSPVQLRVLDSDDPLALVFEVSDAGSGIPAELRDRLFSRGVRAGRHADGAHGLGLYIARRVMEAHGGQADLVSTGPQGSTLKLVLPQHD